MKVYRAIVNDYGYGDCTHLIVSASNEHEVHNYLTEMDYNCDFESISECDGTLYTDAKSIGIIEQF
jgi:hypothetical protein